MKSKIQAGRGLKLNSNQRKLLQRLFTVPADFKFSELRTLLNGFGYVESNGSASSGSRVYFLHPDTKDILLLHKPHPGDEMKKAAVKSVCRFLLAHGDVEEVEV
ncbi:MAG: type II toxin-antitoxin system HicA family toxin [Oscillibacter sp.]|nr:type II toxin-antitoxin system HicA family toxin [Oscillibacter sp.]